MLREYFKGLQKALIKEVKDMKAIFDQIEAEVNQTDVDKQSAAIERKNLLIKNKNLITPCLSNKVFYSVINSEDTVSRVSAMNDA
ncbi:hypothetical protein Tco_0540560 [Tanacetum coccineum]